MKAQEVTDIIRAIGKKIEEEKDFLTELDNVIGDGDHGINMARGFQTVLTKLDSLATDDIGNILKTTGMALVSTVGGASGPLYGTAFMKAGALMAGKTDMSVDDFLACLDAAVEGVKMRGRSTQGEKTMLDAMIPALEAMRRRKVLRQRKSFSKARRQPKPVWNTRKRSSPQKAVQAISAKEASGIRIRAPLHSPICWIRSACAYPVDRLHSIDIQEGILWSELL